MVDIPAGDGSGNALGDDTTGKAVYVNFECNCCYSKLASIDFDIDSDGCNANCDGAHTLSESLTCQYTKDTTGSGCYNTLRFSMGFDGTTTTLTLSIISGLGGVIITFTKQITGRVNCCGTDLVGQVLTVTTDNDSFCDWSGATAEITAVSC